MGDDRRLDRRPVLGATATALAGALAGCSGGDSDGGGDGGGGDTPPSFDGWMADADNYDGVVDETDSDGVTVSVGAQGNGGHLAFDPPAVRVSTGTTVSWEWTGRGGQHNVVARDGADFESELTSEEGFTFEQTFQAAATVTYYCAPHEAAGMKGVVVVE